MGHDHIHFDHEHDEAGPHEHAGPPGPMDAANKSLSDALRLSFRMLSLIMVGILVWLLLTGFTQVESSTRGVRLLFGEIQGEGERAVLGEGLRWSWPKPFGSVVTVPTGTQKLEVKDFWFEVRPEDATQELAKMRPMDKGLRPGRDGALLTGDRGLIHVKLGVIYSIPSGPGGPSAQAIMDSMRNVSDLRELVHAAVCSAAIRAAATRTVESIYIREQKDFQDAVRNFAQERLDKLKAGVRIETVQVPTATVPLDAIGAFDAVTKAASERNTLVTKALQDATTVLTEVCGGSYVKLVGDPNQPAHPGLLQLYAEARERGDTARADTLLAQINDVLISPETEGKAAKIINDARSYRTNIGRRIQARADAFEQFLPMFASNSDLVLQRLWADVKEQVLSSPSNMKIFLTPSGEHTVLKINPDPAMTRRISEELLKTRETKEGRP